ncbi:MAG: glycosyltransferase family 2 protein [Bacteroidales bacterium]|nr:glycosyltransferase family 2 protein [Bacteroidales bacterium]
MDISVIVPVYNEEGNVNLLYSRLSNVLNKICNEWEVIFVNDYSKDNTLSLVKKLSYEDKHINYLSFSRNFGHQIAVSAGLDYCKGKAVVIIDADLQDPPELIEEMYNRYKEGYKVVYAKRKAAKGISFFKRITSKIFYRLLNKMTNIKIPLDTGDFRLIDRVIVEHLKNMPERNKFLRGQIAWLGYRQTSVEFVREARFSGETGYPFSKMLRFALDGITSFSDKPLVAVSKTGFAISGLSFLFILYALVAHFIFKSTISGWTSLMICIAFIGGIQLITIGIIGEYIGRMNKDIRKRPLYIVEETSDKYDENDINSSNV